MIVRRGVLADHYVEGERSVVMVDESVLGLSPIATTILDAVPEGAEVSLQAVRDHVVATFGPPEGPEPAEVLTEQHLWDLVAHRVLVVVENDRLSHGASMDVGVHDLDQDRVDHEGAVTALRDALRHLRSGGDGPWVAPHSLSSQSLVDAARQHHVVPFLAAHLDQLHIPKHARSALEAAAGRQRAGAALLAADLVVALETLNATGVRALAFKGVALARQAYDDYAIRGAGDLDILVAPDDLALAHQALSGAGWRPAAGYPVPGPSWGWRHFVKTGSELTLTAPNSDIDLHWHLVPTRGTFPAFDTLWSRREIVSVAGHAVPTLAPYDALTHAAGHAAKDRWRWMRSLVDVHTLMADPETWLGADRPLRRDQMLSVGLAAHELGIPESAPPIIHLAKRVVGHELLERVHHDQVETAPGHRVHAIPGVNFVFGLISAARTNWSPREAGRLLSRSALPPWLTRDEASTHVWVAAPRVLTRRARDAVRRAID